MNEVRRGLREQKIERVRFCCPSRSACEICALRAPRVRCLGELRSPARGARTNGALVPYIRVFWCFWGRPDGVGKEPAASDGDGMEPRWRR